MKCPDCGKELDTVIVKVRSSKHFYTDNERQLLIPTPNHDWRYGDYCCHCPHCDSLKVDELLRDYELEDGYRSLIQARGSNVDTKGHRPRPNAHPVLDIVQTVTYTPQGKPNHPQ